MISINGFVANIHNTAWIDFGLDKNSSKDQSPAPRFLTGFFVLIGWIDCPISALLWRPSSQVVPTYV